jgi:hypothetical protein
MKLMLALTAFVVLAGVTLGHPQHAAATPYCTPEVELDGSEIYGQVFDAKPIRKNPLHAKAIVPKPTLGAKLYVRAQKGVTSSYLQRAAVCHSVSRTTPSYVNDPLRVDGKIKSIRVQQSGGAFVVSVLGENRATGMQIWQRAKALTSEVDTDFTGAVNEEVSEDL